MRTIDMSLSRDLSIRETLGIQAISNGGASDPPPIGDMNQDIDEDGASGMSSVYAPPSSEHYLGPSSIDGGPADLLEQHNGCWFDLKG